MIDHLVYATLDPKRALPRLEEQLGTPLVAGGRHLGFGTRNWLAALGDRMYLEVLAPDPDQPTPSQPRPFGFDQLLTGQEPAERLIAWCARAASPLGGVQRRLSAAGVEYGAVLPMSRHTPSGDLLEWELTVPTDHLALRAGIPFFIRWGRTPHPASALATGPQLIELRVPDHHPLIGQALVEMGGDRRVSVTNRVSLLEATVTVDGTEVVL